MQILTKTNRSILAEMVRTDFKLRYQSSVLGYLWSLLKPLMLSLILYIVFVKFLKVGGGIRHYASYLLLGIMCWTFFSEVTIGGVGSVVGKGDLIRKISIPRYLTVVSSSASALINFIFNLVVLVVIMLFAGVEVQLRLLWLVPLLLAELYVISLSLAFILSAMFVKFRDVSFMWEVFMQMFFYLTPILYPITVVTEKYPQAKILLLSPIAQIIQDLRHIIVTPQSYTSYQAFGALGVFAPLLVVSIISIFSVWYFRREAKYFAENV
jgi:ABC-2 type transport system permease protein